MNAHRAVVGGDISTVHTHIGDVGGVVHCAGMVVIVGKGTAVVQASDGTVMISSSDIGIENLVTRQGARVGAGNATNFFTSISVIIIPADGHFADAIRDCTVVDTHNAAVILERMTPGMNSDSASDVAVRDGCTFINITSNGAHLRLTGDAGIADGEILNIGIRTKITKETVLVMVIIGCKDAEAADGLSVAVEMAIES